MSPVARNVIGWAAAGAVSLQMLVSVYFKVHVVEIDLDFKAMFVRGGIYELRYYLAVADLIITALFLLPRTMTLGFVLMVGYWGGATATVITHGDYAELPLHLTNLALLLAASWFRHPEIWARFLLKPVADT